MKKYSTAILIVILVLAFTLRFWQVPQYFFFGIDEEYQSLLALSIIKDFHIIWIGLSAASTGFYIGPGLVYFHAFLLWISKLDPVILGYAASLTGTITVISLYFIVKHLFDKKTAIISTLFYGLSAYIVMYDRRFWNSTFVPITALLFYLSYVKSLKNPRWYILTAILLGLSFHIHASLFIFIPITIAILFWRLQEKIFKFDFISGVLSVFCFVVIYSPLIVFDFVHNFDNLKTPIRILQQSGKSGGFSFMNHFEVMKTTISQFWYLNKPYEILTLGLLIISLGIICWFILRKKNITENILTTIICFYLAMLIFYPGKVLDYYYLGFLPFFSIIIARFLKQFDKLSLVSLSLIFIIPNIIAVFKFPSDQGLEMKRNLIKKTIEQLGAANFYLETDREYLYFGGWRYLFEAYGKKPSSSQADQMFGWIYQKEISPKKPKFKVVISDNYADIKTY